MGLFRCHLFCWKLKIKNNKKVTIHTFGTVHKPKSTIHGHGTVPNACPGKEKKKKPQKTQCKKHNTQTPSISSNFF